MAGLHTVAYRGGWVVEMGVGVAFIIISMVVGGGGICDEGRGSCWLHWLRLYWLRLFGF